MTPPPSPFRARLKALLQRCGLGQRVATADILQACTLGLPNVPETSSDSICWQQPLPLYRLHALTRGSLSGPVQDDKNLALSALAPLVSTQVTRFAQFDLRQIDGFAQMLGSALPFSSFEDFSASEYCKHIRIISYKDFEKALDTALPKFRTAQPIALLQANWRGDRFFWAGEEHAIELACALAYARRRELQITLPATVTRYQLNPEAVCKFAQHYHALGIANTAWSNPEFISLLIDSHVPYSRLQTNNAALTPDLLLLPRQNKASEALGHSLLKAGATDILAYLQTLQCQD